MTPAEQLARELAAHDAASAEERRAIQIRHLRARMRANGGSIKRAAIDLGFSRRQVGNWLAEERAKED